MTLNEVVRGAVEQLKSTREARSLLGGMNLIRHRRAIRWGASVVVAAVAIGGWAFVLTERAPKPPPGDEPQSASAELLAIGTPGPGREVTVLLGQLPGRLPDDLMPYWSRFTPDGESLVYLDDAGQVASMELDTGAVREVAGCPAGCDVSPDGSHVVLRTRAGGRLVVHDLTFGEVTIIRADTSSPAVSWWSPDGSTIALVGSRGIHLVRSDGTGLRELVAFQSPTPLGFASLTWAPDGRSIAFVTPRGPDRGRLRFTLSTIAVDGSGRRELADLGGCICKSMTPPLASWSPDEEVIAFTTTEMSGMGRSRPGDIWTMRPDGTERRRLGPSSHTIWLLWRPGARTS